MKVVIHYWSATGNTARAAEWAACELRENSVATELCDIRTNRQPALQDTDLWVICTPVFDFRPALPVQDFLHALKELPPVPVAAVLTYAAFHDRSVLRLANWIRRAGAVPWDWIGLRSEDSWPIARKYLKIICSTNQPDPEAVAEYRTWWRQVPSRLCRKDHGSRWWRPPTPATLLTPFYSRRVVKHWFRIGVDQERCIECGKCEEQCPTGRMRISNFPRPQGDCVGCYGCINICPEEAVHSWLTKNAPQYSSQHSHV